MLKLIIIILFGAVVASAILYLIIKTAIKDAINEKLDDIKAIIQKDKE